MDNAAEGIRGESNLQIILKDVDTGIEVTSTVTIMTANQAEARRQIARAFKDTLDRLWPWEVGDDGPKG